jgi:hypothetical protein
VDLEVCWFFVILSCTMATSRWLVCALVLACALPFGQAARGWGLETPAARNNTMGKRTMLEHAVVFQLKATANDDAKQGIVDGLLSLKESCAEWVKTEAVGYLMDPSQAKGASLGLYQRFESLATLDEYFYSEAKAVMVKKYMVPFMTGEITFDFEVEVDDDESEAVLKGVACKDEVIRIVGIKVKEGTSQQDMDSMVKSLNDLNDAPELKPLLTKITAGRNLCPRDQRYTHALVARLPSVEALKKYSTHPYHISVISKTVWPIAETTLTADFVSECGSAQQKSLL